MPKKSSQTQVRIVIFLLSAIPFYHTDFSVENYTGILNHGNRLLFWICFIPLFCLLTLLAWKKRPFDMPLHRWRKKILFAALLVLSVLFFPYPKQETWTSQMHVLMGIFAFIYIQTVVLAWIKNHRRLQDDYRFLLFLIFLLTASFGCINGLTEIIAVNAFSFLVTCETNETFCDTLLHRKGIPS